MDTGGYYFIDPDGGGTGDELFMVFCNMTMYNDNGVTVISHDSENATLVDGYEARSSYSRIVTYTGINLTQIATLVGISKKCLQFIKFECFGVELFGRDMAWWVSRDGNKMNYWGRLTPTVESAHVEWMTPVWIRNTTVTVTQKNSNGSKTAAFRLIKTPYLSAK